MFPRYLVVITKTYKDAYRPEERPMNLTVGRGAAVHVAFGDLPRCDTGTGARGGSSRKTDAPVTCKRCLRIVPTANTAARAKADTQTSL